MRKFFKIFLYILGSILVLLIAAVVWLNTPSGKNFVRAQAESFLRKKLKTEVYIGGLGYGLPKYIVLERVLFKDQAKDTLLAVGELRVNISMLRLLKSEVVVQSLKLEGVHAHIYRNAPDTNFNFTYIINAFTGGDKPKEPKAEKPEDTSSGTPLKIDVDKVTFDDIHIKFEDYTGGMRMGLDLEHLLLKMKKVDLETMTFHVKKLEIAGLSGLYSADTSLLPPKPKDTTTTETQFQLVADDIDLQRIGFTYNDYVGKLLFSIGLGKLQVALKKFDLAKSLVDVDKLALNNTNVKLVMGKNANAPAVVDTIVKIDTTEGWRVTAKDLQLANVNFLMDNENDPRQKSGIDYSHLDVRQLALNAKDVLYGSDTIAGNIKHLAVREKSGLDLRELKTTFAYYPQGAYLHNLYLQTSNTVLQDLVEIRYPSIDALKTRMDLMELKINLKKSIIGLRDVLTFVPTLESQDLFKKYKNGHLQIETNIAGYMNRLNINRFYLAGMNNTTVLLSGKLNGLPDADKLNYNLNIAKLQSSRSDLEALLPKEAVASIQLPERFGISGQVAGTAKDYNTDMLIVSTDGNAYLKGYVHMSPGTGRERYDMYVRTDNLNVGRILKQDSVMSTITANFTAKGQGFDINTMTAALKGDIQWANVKGYRYHDITLDGKIANKVGDINMKAVDTNLQLQLTAHADLTNEHPAVKADIQLDSIDLQALKLYATELRARGLLHIDFPVLNPDYPYGTFVWEKPVIVANGQRYKLDSMYIVAKSKQDSGQNIVADFEMIHATIGGRTPLTRVGDILQDHINRRYTLPALDSARRAKRRAERIARGDTARRVPGQYGLQLTADIEDHPLLHSVLPGLTSMEKIHMDARLTRRTLELNANIPEIIYGSTVISRGKATVRGNDSAFTYQVSARRIEQGNIHLWYPNVNGRLDTNQVSANVVISDTGKKERFVIGAVMHLHGDTQVIVMQPRLLLDYQEWQVATPNRIVLAPAGLYVDNFGISNGTQYIKANSDQPVPNTPLKVDISNLLLANLTKMISTDTVLVNGVLGGNVTIQKLKPAPEITSTLQIEHLSVMGDTLGNLTVEVNNKDANALNANIAIKGQGNNIGLTGVYYMQAVNGKNFDMTLKIDPLNMGSIKKLAMGQIRNSSGYLRGDLHLQGTASSPVLTGTLQTDQLTTTISSLNAYFKMPSSKITFTENGIAFNNFDIFDSSGNKATLDGEIVTRDLNNLRMNMNVKARNWRALHSTSKDNKVFYGDLLLTTDLSVKGPLTGPDIDGSLNILKGTNVTVVMPENNPSMQNSEGVVEFINMSDTGRKLLVSRMKKKDTVRVALAPGSSINVNMSIDKDAQFSVIIDPATGDFLSVRGVANLNASVSPTGTVALSGNYQLNDGQYQLNYNFIKRKFTIQKGSTITFAGDPLKAYADVTAVYEANVAPFDLVQREVPDQNQLNFYKQRLPFNVELHLDGPILKPNITFNVVLPENKVYPMSSDKVDLVRAKLAQIRTDTSELNKQVFALLILNRFVAEDPFSSGTSTSAEVVAKQSVSRFISEQLNQLAGSAIKGVDLSVDLNTTEDYTTGAMRERTDLSLAASKRLLNDRLKLTIGNDFELEGPQTSNSNENALIPSNLAADYLLTQDGRYTMRGYRKSYDAGVLQGFVTETGVNFIVSIDYNKFKNIFKNRKPKKEQAKSAPPKGAAQ